MNLPRSQYKCGGCGIGISNTEPVMAIWDKAAQDYVLFHHPRRDCEEEARKQFRGFRPPQENYERTFFSNGYAPEETKKSAKSPKRKGSQ